MTHLTPGNPDVFQAIFMASSVPCVLLEPDAPRYTIREANEAYSVLTQSKRTDMVGTGLFDHFPDGTEEQHGRCIERLRKSLFHVLQYRQDHELPVQQSDIFTPSDHRRGIEQRFWMSRNSPILDGEGNLMFILHRVEDYTDRIRAESERRRFADVASDVLVKIGFDGYFQEVSSRCEAILGWTAEEMKERRWMDFVHPDDRDATLQALKRVLRGEEIHQFENRYRSRDGTYRWLSWNSLTITGERAIYCAAGDITQSHRLRAVAEGQKRALELSVQGEKLSIILDGLVHAIEDNAGYGVRASIMLVSPDGQRLLTGAAPSLPDAFNDALHGSPIGAERNSCAAVAATGEAYLTEDISTDPGWYDLSEITQTHNLLACWSTPILSSFGTVSGTLTLYYDRPTAPSSSERQLVDIISRTAGVVIERESNLKARRRAERQIIKARNEAEAANIAKSEFLANMSHEIRTPMNVVLGVANILGQHEQLSDEQTQLVGTLQNSANNLLALIDDLLDISRIEAHNIELERVAFRMEELLADVADILTPRARQKGLEFTLVGAEKLNGRFVGDPARIRQVILNLCNNSLKFTEQGSVRISVSRRPAGTEGVALVAVAVTDTGIGIEPDKQEKIFQKFTQVDSSITRKFGGSGLGLSITRQLVNAMGGEIAVESTPGKGSTFTATFPLMVDNRQTLSVTPLEEDSAAKPESSDPERRILLVEDFQPNVIITSRYLRVYGYAHDVVSNGLEAVDKARSRRYAAILMDVQMPELNGYEATRRIRAHERANGLPPTPIIAMTAYALSGDRERCLNAGMNDYVAKPYSAEELKSKLERFVPAV